MREYLGCCGCNAALCRSGAIGSSKADDERHKSDLIKGFADVHIHARLKTGDAVQSHSIGRYCSDGDVLETGAARSTCVALNPSITGICRSIRIASKGGSAALAASTANCPLLAAATRATAAMSTRFRMFCVSTVMRESVPWITVYAATAAPLERAVKAVKVAAVGTVTTKSSGVSVEELLPNRFLSRITMAVVAVLVIVAVPLFILGLRRMLHAPCGNSQLTVGGNGCIKLCLG